MKAEYRVIESGGRYIAQRLYRNWPFPSEWHMLHICRGKEAAIDLINSYVASDLRYEEDKKNPKVIYQR